MLVGLQQTIDDLMEFGLSKLQAQIYISMIKLGKSRASDIAYDSKVNRSEVYRILPSLQKLGLVEVSYAKPITFIPTPSDEGIPILLNNLKKHLSQLEEQSNQIILNLKRIERKTVHHPIGFKVILGRKKCYEKIIDMLNHSKKEILYATSGKGFRRELKAELYDEFYRTKIKGVKIKLITEITSLESQVVKKIKKNCELRYLKQLPFHMLIMDDEEVLVGAIVSENNFKEAESNINLWMNNKIFIDIIKTSFNQLWKKSKRI